MVLSKARVFAYNMLIAVRSLFWKRDKKTVLIGSWFGEKFADNPRYLFQYLADNKTKLGLNEVVWVTRNEKLFYELNQIGYKIVMMYTKESAFYHKHAGLHIICNNPVDTELFKGDINGILSYGAKRIDLWHGIGLKGVGFASNEYKFTPFIKRFIKNYLGILNYVAFVQASWYRRFVLSTTPETTKIFYKYFKLPKKFYIESAYPRNCKVPLLLSKEKEVLEKFKDFKTVILYLPTFRTGNDKFDFTGFSEKLKDTLEENSVLWLQKAHSADSENNITYSRVGNVLNLDPGFDINVLMPHITLLVTDYSSVMFDAMYHRKPVLYLVPDFEEYKNGDRGFVIEPDTVMCGPKFFDIQELKRELPKYCQNPKLAIWDGYEGVREKYWGNASKDISDIWNDIVKHIEKN